MKHAFKTRFPLVLAMAALALSCLFTACGAAKEPLPEGMTEEEVRGYAENTVALLTDEDYTGLEATMDTVLLDALKDTSLEDAWAPAREAAGDFVSIDKFECFGKQGCAVAILKAKYSKLKFTFTLSYTPEGKLNGIYYR